MDHSFIDCNKQQRQQHLNTSKAVNLYEPAKPITDTKRQHDHDMSVWIIVTFKESERKNGWALTAYAGDKSSQMPPNLESNGGYKTHLQTTRSTVQRQKKFQKFPCQADPIRSWSITPPKATFLSLRKRFTEKEDPSTWMGKKKKKRSGRNGGGHLFILALDSYGSGIQTECESHLDGAEAILAAWKLYYNVGKMVSRWIGSHRPTGLI